jgi:hypothetical protein
MARFNEILVGRYNRLFQKLFSVKGTAPVPVLSTEIQPQIQVFTGAELRYLEGWDQFGVSAFQGAVVAQNSTVRFRNAIGSNMVAVLRKLEVSPAAGGGCTVFMNRDTAADLATLISAVSMERRGRLFSTLIISSTGAAGVGAAIWSQVMTANQLLPTMEEAAEGLVLSPGSSIDIQGPVNTGLQVNCWWRERFLEESERT